VKRFESWGRYPKSEAGKIVPLFWRSDVPQLNSFDTAVLAYGRGRSYGDCCLNGGGALLDTSTLDHFMEFDAQAGVLRCEAGVALGEISRLTVPQGWFLAVTPGTQFVTVGGAIANDVHGKNHHRAGSFGCSVIRFELLRSDGERIECSRERNAGLFSATVGGLGLTGLILWAEIALQSVRGPWIDCEQIAFGNVDEALELFAASDANYEYTVGWLDCLAGSPRFGGGLLLRGNHSAQPATKTNGHGGGRRHELFFDVPQALLNRLTIRAFNWSYYHANAARPRARQASLDEFFYPLDGVAQWNRFYGISGFVQYQCLLPNEQRGAVRQILDLMQRSAVPCTLAVLKVFGEIPSPGIMSFPRAGVTLALDFPCRQRLTLDLCERFDEVVRACGGAVYPAKDARMSPLSFHTYTPRLADFVPYLDPQFSSDFWRRVTDSR
jgi:FAD/FMN-containing dehydrogenase